MTADTYKNAPAATEATMVNQQQTQYSKPAALTLMNSTRPARLCKQFTLTDGKLKKHGAGQVAAGQVQRLEVPTPGLLAELWQSLAPNQAFIFGLPSVPTAQVVPVDKLPEAPPGTIARTAEEFQWPSGPGWMMFDYDPAPGAEALSRDQWLEILREAVPAIATAPSVWGVSASSEIWNTETGEQLQGITGQRLYILVADARDIPRAGTVLVERLWLAGHGYYQVTKAGRLLKRCAVDACVWQTNRLDFAAPPQCIEPLEARRPEPLVFNDDAAPLDTATAFPPLSDAERQRLAEIYKRDAEAEDLLAEQQMARDEWIEERLGAIPASDDKEREEARQRLNDAVTRGRLFGDFELVHSSGRRVLVGDLLDNPEQWHGERFADPLEPGYSNGDKRIAWANLRSGGTPYIYSHAHWGQRFRLLRPAAILKMTAGDMPNMLPKVLERLRMDAEVYERAGELVRLADGELVAVEPAWLQTYLETAFQFLRFDSRAKEWRASDCPHAVAARVMANRGGWGVPKVAGLVSFPVMRPDGSVIERPGFDEATGLLFLDDAENRPTPRPLEREALRAALARIWEPFELFPFVDDLSRGVFLAALLTTVTRAALPTAPGFLVRAHSPGTGKTLASECLMMIAGARATALPLPENNPEEIEKRLFAKLLTGCAGLILDNLTGVIDNAAMCAMLTSAEPEGRILGRSKNARVVNRAFWILNGNNVSAAGDTFRRILPITLDANTETPETRRFTFDPRELIRGRLDAYRADLLSVLLSYQAAGAPQVGKGSLGSFETWESLVRQAVCWLIREDLTPAPMADPVEVLKLSRAEDPRRLQHAAMLRAWWVVFGSNPVEVREIAKIVDADFIGQNVSHNELREIATEIGAPPGRRFDSRYFAGWLRRNAGVVVEGMRVDKAEGPGCARVQAWQVTALPESGQSEAPF